MLANKSHVNYRKIQNCYTYTRSRITLGFTYCMKLLVDIHYTGMNSTKLITKK